MTHTVKVCTIIRAHLDLNQVQGKMDMSLHKEFRLHFSILMEG